MAGGWAQKDEFGIALILIIVTIVSLPLADVGAWGRLVSVLFAGATLLFILYTAQAKRATLLIAVVVVAAGCIASTVAVVAGGDELAEATTASVGALLAVVAPMAIIRRLLATTAITRSTIGAALCLYLLIGLFFSFVYSLLGAVDAPFFAQATSDRTINYVYFSFTTLTTTGFGDLTPREPTGKMLAVSEALLGQLYLVSVVALLVSNVSWQRKPK